ncbi:pyridoxal phosphate-dependent aminotransferase [Salipiger sp. PrR002]|uniref:pyridoxal phosphate-dependent aminotransferase n=1 Tax=Salipiger sp. PrR002 TaxID=2706489 RepID=UPI0013BB7B0F|nr:pyridoxal phosphate-dependent aminotransferase [Salipiger sp. PrR002]NDW02649.1 pyridoxal phosphate-dependent aminotransferase [Salipiger sp. PrR002]NDW59906.1 pyridoxal phosphate-dependent aminotransferase [Salipiger sp. PrR004]
MTQYLASRMAAVRPSPTIELALKLQQMKAEGHDIISLGQGELDFATPEHIAEAGIAAIRGGQTKYTASSGTPELKAAIAAKFERENGLSYKPSQIIAGNGAKQLVFNALMATLDAGDEVIIPAPYWVSYPDMVSLAGGTPVIAPCTAENGWKLTPETLAAALTPKTKWVLLNSPNNPTGALYSEADIAALCKVLADHHTLIMADDIYELVVHEGSFATPAAVAPELADRILTVNGVSKGYAMTGWRLGYAAGPEWLVRAMDILQSQSTSNPSAISQAATVAALTAPADFLPERNARLKARRDMVIAAIDKMPGITCATPPASFYVFPDCTGLFGARTPEGKVIESDMDVADFLLTAGRIGVVPGSAFGTPGYLRLAYALDDARLEEAMQRAIAALETLQLAVPA